MNGTVLVIDDERELRSLLAEFLEERGYQVSLTASPDDGLRLATAGEIDAVITDIRLGDGVMNGLELCERIVESAPDTPVIVMTGFGTMETAIAAVRVGAYDFLTKPLDMNRLEISVRRAVQHIHLAREVARLRQQIDAGHGEELLGDSKPMKRIYTLIEQVAASDASVLISGESGTGKELVARAIHRKSAQKDGPFIAINCAAMPATLLESELFGHVRGAFTDAKEARDGLFIKADGGTLFLDEIGEMPSEMQAKLLRVLQERKVRPLGAAEEVAFDTRLISATNKDLDSAVEEGSFREDLYYRINVVGLRVPPLRSRGNDILLLAQHFLQDAASRTEKAVKGIAPEAAQRLLEYDWPGNVRELENIIERAVTLTQFEEIVEGDLPEKIRSHRSERIIIEGQDPEELPTLEEVERRYIRRVLSAVGGNKTQAAQVLGLDRRTLYRRLARYESDE